MACLLFHTLTSSGDQLVNPIYEGDDILSLQPRAPMPAYETIPLHPRDEATLELLEQGGSGYSVLSRKQNVNTPESTVKMVSILEDNKEESYSKLELSVNCNNIGESSQDGDYGKLETLNIEFDTIKNNITGQDVHEEARNVSEKGYERSTDNLKVNSEQGVHEMENCDSDSEIDNKEGEKIQPMIARASDTQNIRYVAPIEYQLISPIECLPAHSASWPDISYPSQGNGSYYKYIYML